MPKKNLQTVGGKSLVRRAIEAALATAQVDRVLVSTDGDDIAAEARSTGAEVIDRPAELAGDTALVKNVLIDIRSRLREGGESAEIMVLLEPTACLRLAADVAECLDRLGAENLDSVATFTSADPHPHRTWRIEDGRPHTFIPGVVPWQNRQSLPPAYRLNGAVYAFRMDGLIEFDEPGLLFGRSGAVLMPSDRSVDIDSWIDLDIANAVYHRQQRSD